MTKKGSPGPRISSGTATQDLKSGKEKDRRLPEKEPPGAGDPEASQSLVNERSLNRQRTKKIFPVVGIGASAGGLKALEDFFDHVPRKCGMAFVVVQHLSPTHKSIMGELLKKHTELPVLEITNGLKVREDTIYLNPPDRSVSIQSGIFRLEKATHGGIQRYPIDYFFRSLASEMAERAFCVILSGSGTDGTLGLEAVKGNGGMTMVQEEQQAEYSSMPESAIKTGLVDFVLPAEAMAAELMKYARHPYVAQETGVPSKSKHFEVYSQKILLHIRKMQRHDFTHYKQNTIRRRIERRMAVHRLDDIAAYYRYLQENSMEGQALFRELLISVTSFFRDNTAFYELEHKIIPALVERKEPDSVLRIWVPGSATGEEAYSIAILVTEAMERMEKHLSVQIFATDIDYNAIDRARAGEYTESIAVDVSPERLKRFFVKESGTYRIRKEIREMIVFSVQNIVTDPPFSRLDLISCRNVLIYLDTELQKRLIPLFHYALANEGFLFLGTSETIGQFTDLFNAVDMKAKIFRKKPMVMSREISFFPRPSLETAELERIEKHNKIEKQHINVREIVERTVLDYFAPPCVLINSKNEALYFFGDTRKFLEPPHGEASLNILNMCPESLRREITALLKRVMDERVPVSAEAAVIGTGESRKAIDIILHPLESMNNELSLLVFEERRDSKGMILDRLESEVIDERVVLLEQDLKSTRDYLQTLIEELETSNEELKSTNEELQSTNEELQSTNEEVETSKEELQSTNEELITVNTELQNKVDELTQANNDIANLLTSTDIGTIFLDTNLGIKRFTPVIRKFFNLIPGDIGRSIKDITTKIAYEPLYEEAEEVLNTLQSRTQEVTTEDGRCYVMRLLPYRTREKVIEGVVMTFVDITEVKRAERMALEARDFAEAIVNTVRESLVVLDEKFCVVTANRSFYRFFGLREELTIGKLIYDLADSLWDIPSLRELLERVLPRAEAFNDYPLRQTVQGVGERTLMLNGRQIIRREGSEKLILLAIEDVGEKAGSGGLHDTGEVSEKI